MGAYPGNTACSLVPLACQTPVQLVLANDHSDQRSGARAQPMFFGAGPAAWSLSESSNEPRSDRVSSTARLRRLRIRDLRAFDSGMRNRHQCTAHDLQAKLASLSIDAGASPKEDQAQPGGATPSPEELVMGAQPHSGPDPIYYGRSASRALDEAWIPDSGN